MVLLLEYVFSVLFPPLGTGTVLKVSMWHRYRKKPQKTIPNPSPEGPPECPPLRWNCYGVGRAFQDGGVMSVLCHVFPPVVSIFGLFPVLVKCDYELILVQLCFSHYPVYL